MKDCTRRGDIVLDTFCGSGTTILAAERVGRRAYTLEIEPRFVDVAIKRWQAFSRKDAIHAETGLTFDEVASRRTAEPRRRVGLLSRSTRSAAPPRPIAPASIAPRYQNLGPAR